MKEWITGRNPVYECLRANRRNYFRLLIGESVNKTSRVQEIFNIAKERGIRAESAARKDLEKIHRNNQGIALETSAYPYSDIDSIFQKSKKSKEPFFLLILDQIQDPQNFGTLIRSAELFGVHGIVMPSRRAAGITPAVVNASSGASEHMLITQGNLAQASALIKEKNGWVIGLDMEKSSVPLGEVDWRGNLALIVGSEGTGLRRLVRESCDIIAHIPMSGTLDSLNAAVAGSIAIYTAAAQRNT